MNPLDDLIYGPSELELEFDNSSLDSSTPFFLYGKVDAIDPLVVTIDGDDEPLEIEPSSTVDGILPNDRVQLILQDDELIITGIVDGDVDYIQDFIDGIGIAHDAIANISAEPAAPEPPELTDERYLDPFGRWRSKVTATWPAVEEDVNGNPMTISRYELWGQPVVDSTPGLWRGIAAASGTSVSSQPFDIGSVWRFALVAVGHGRTSARGAYSLFTFGVDTTPPNRPAQPGASIYLGAVVVSWTGKDVGGAAMPGDFDRCEVHVSTVSDFTPTPSTFKGIITPAGTLTLSGLDAGTPYFIQLVAYDIAGNASLPSVQRSATPEKIGYVDLDPTVAERLTAADGKTTNYYQSSEPTGGTYVLGDTWFDTDDGNKIYRWSGSAWVAASLGSSAIENAAITNAKIANLDAAKIDTGVLNAARLGAGSITADKMSATDIFTINNYSGPTTGNHTRMTPDGFSAWGGDPASGLIKPFARFGNGLDFGFDPAQPKASIDGNGNASMSSLATAALKVGGSTLEEILEPLPRGRLAYAQLTASVTGVSTTQVSIVELRANLQPNRLYEISTADISARGSAANAILEWNLRVAYDGNAVTSSSPMLRNVRQQLGAAGVYIATPPMTYDLQTAGQAGEREVRFLLTAKRYGGSGTIDIWGSDGIPIQLRIRDEGSSLGPSTIKIRRTSVWTPSAVYQHSSSAATTTVTDTWRATTGPSSRSLWAQVMFLGTASSGEPGKTIATALSGATLVKAEVLLQVTQGESTQGLMYKAPLDARGFVHPSHNVTSNNAIPGTYLKSSVLAPPVQEWVNVTSLWGLNSRSAYFTLTPPGGGLSRSMIGNVNQIRLRLTYDR